MELLPREVHDACAAHLLAWERIALGQTCCALRHVSQDLEYGYFDQVKNKHYMQLQLIDQYNEWTDLKRRRRQGQSIVFAPNRFLCFVRAYNNVKLSLMRDRPVKQRRMLRVSTLILR